MFIMNYQVILAVNTDLNNLSSLLWFDDINFDEVHCGFISFCKVLCFKDTLKRYLLKKNMNGFLIRIKTKVDFKLLIKTINSKSV